MRMETDPDLTQTIIFRWGANAKRRADVLFQSLSVLVLAGGFSMASMRFHVDVIHHSSFPSLLEKPHAFRSFFFLSSS